MATINFVHEEDGVFVNGTLSAIDGTPYLWQWSAC